jgi:uncharacterized protein YjiS (DUF1127 family)
MSQMISSKSDGFQVRAHGAYESGRTGGGLLTAIFAMLLRWPSNAWRMHCDEKLLQELSDYQLRDIGIRRGQIPRIVRRGPEW